MRTKLQLIVLGIVGQTPFAGVAWQALHYVEGLRRLGHEVFYVEDTGTWPLDLDKESVTDDSTYTVNYIARLMTWCGMDDHWAYRSVAEGGRVYGLSESRLASVFQQADAIINVPAATRLQGEQRVVPVRMYLETDPVAPQIEVAQGRLSTIEFLNAHTHYFTYAENLGAPDCGVPLDSFDYRPTRQPIVLDWWSRERFQPPSADARLFTSVASWKQSGRDISWNGKTYTWSKHHEFLKFIDLPRQSGKPFELALACRDREVIGLLRSHGWQIVDAIAVSKDILSYRDYIFGSRGEFTVAKDQNIRLRSGWFSDRSACYLAAGRPVITQDTGFGAVLPTGEGLFAFNTTEEIMAALQAIEADYEKHSRAAREIAQEYFCAEKVLARLLDDSGL